MLNQWFWEEKSRDIWSIGWVLYEMLTGSKFQYDPNDSSSISYPLGITEDWNDFLWKCLEFDPQNRATINNLIVHPFIKIEEEKERKTLETINFLSLFSYVSRSEKSLSSKNLNYEERLSKIKVKSKYMSRDSLQGTYRITNELFDALGFKSDDNKKASLWHIQLDMNFLNSYSRKSIMLQSLTNAKPEDFEDTKRSSLGEDLNFDSSKLDLILKRIRNGSISG